MLSVKCISQLPDDFAQIRTRSELRQPKGDKIARIALLFTPMSITPLIGMEDAHIVLNVSRPSPKAILNDGIRYCLQVTCEQ